MENSERKIQGSNVCVIGGCGFLGSHLVNYLIVEKGCKVVVLDSLITGQKKWLHPAAIFIWFDITNSENRLKDLFVDYEIEFVFNYAAEPYVPLSFTRPLHVFDINSRAALLVMNAAQSAGVKGILQVSSAEIYGAHEKDAKISEDEPVIPHSSYGVSKTAADGFVQVRWKEAKTPAIAMRQFNCVGERETHQYIIPEIISQIHNSEQVYNMSSEVSEGATVKIFLGNDTFRDFQYAGDAVAMAVELLEKGNFGEVYNMGSEEGIKIYDLAREIGLLMQGVEVNIETSNNRKRPWEIWHLQSDNTKLYSVIETRPKVKLKEALQRTIKYFYENGSKWDF